MGNYQRVFDTEEHILTYHRREDEGKRLQQYLPDALPRECAVVDLDLREESLCCGRETLGVLVIVFAEDFLEIGLLGPVV